MADSVEARAPILAAGGIVLREGSRPRIAIVRLRREKAWVLPKGKLNRGERPHAAAKREVLEETGHDVSVHEFLGSMSYPVDSKIKIVQFWHMRAIGGPVRKLNRDVKAVKWLPLKEAIDALSRVHEKVFLANVGPAVVKAAKQAVREQAARNKAKPVRNPANGVKRAPRRVPASASVQVPTPVPAVHLISDQGVRTRQSTFVEALGGWIGRMTQSSLRRTG